MKIIKLSDGLGNQMFQYAFGYALQQRQPEETVLYDCSAYLEEGRAIAHEGLELERIFGIVLPKATQSDIALVLKNKNRLSKKILRNIHPMFHTQLNEHNLSLRPQQHGRHKKERLGYFYPWAQRMKQDVQYLGYWQSEKYFSKYRKELRDILKFPQPESAQTAELFDAIEKDASSVSIHVRRGDYAELKERYGELGKGYYKRAMEYMLDRVPKAHFYVCSNDIEWSREFLSEVLAELKAERGESATLTYIDFLDSRENYFFSVDAMKRCRHNIIAHSTFSWWGAWLNDHAGKIVVAPKKWYAHRTARDDKRILDFKVPKAWIVLATS